MNRKKIIELFDAISQEETTKKKIEITQTFVQAEIKKNVRSAVKEYKQEEKRYRQIELEKLREEEQRRREDLRARRKVHRLIPNVFPKMNAVVSFEDLLLNRGKQFYRSEKLFATPKHDKTLRLEGFFECQPDSETQWQTHLYFIDKDGDFWASNSQQYSQWNGFKGIITKYSLL